MISYAVFCLNESIMLRTEDPAGRSAGLVTRFTSAKQMPPEFADTNILIYAHDGARVLSTKHPKRSFSV